MKLFNKIKDYFILSPWTVLKSLIVVGAVAAVFISSAFVFKAVFGGKAFLGALGVILFIGGVIGSVLMGLKTKKSFKGKTQLQRQDKLTHLFLTVFLGVVSIMGVYTFILMWVD